MESTRDTTAPFIVTFVVEKELPLPTSQRPPTRTLTFLLPIAAVWAIGLWVLLRPAYSIAQQTETPTPGVTVITPTPEPPNVFAAATQSIQLTEQAAREGTPTPLPRHLRVATRTPTPRIATATPTAANSATAAYHASYATAIALTTGTPYFTIATSTPTAFIITPTPRPANVFEAATRKAEQEAQGQSAETPTPLPDNVIVATATATPRIVTNTPMPANDATATADAIYATAVAYTTGMSNVVTATPTNTPTPRQSTRTTQDASTEEPPTSTPTRATPVGEPATITPADSLTPTPASIPAVVQRIRFAPGATSATVEGYVDFDQPVHYVLHAQADQSMTVKLRNQYGYSAYVEISTAQGTFIGSADAGKTWKGVLPATQDYYLTIYVPADSVGHDYSLWIEILP
jgi:hypothetical protein